MRGREPPVALTPDDVKKLQRVVAQVCVRTLVVVFSTETRCEDATLLYLAKSLASNPSCRFVLRGVTIHQSRMLRYLGFQQEPTQPEA
jgi:hypothetical protein